MTESAKEKLGRELDRTVEGKTMRMGPFAFWVISPFAGLQLWSYYCVLNENGLPAIAVQLSS
jgi:hypothetical protein